jgi:hypothetical protein
MTQTNISIERAKQKAEVQYHSLRTALDKTLQLRVGSSTGQFHSGNSVNDRRKSVKESSGLQHPAGRHRGPSVEAGNENSL